MRIDSPTGIKAWLIGKFSGSFKGNLEGTADSASYAESSSYALSTSYAESASYAEVALEAYTASYVKVENVDGVDERIKEVASQDLPYLPLTGGTITGSLDVVEKLVAQGKLHAKNIVAADSDIETSGSLKLHNVSYGRGAEIRYVPDEDALEFRFTSRTYPGDDTGSVDPEPEPEPEPTGSVDPTGSVEPTGSSGVHVPGVDDTDITIPNTTG